MFSRLHNKLGTAGLVVAIVALVAALTGAAFAAGGLTKQQEKQVKKIARKFAGKQGPTGPQGPKGDTGPQGPKGDRGLTGPPGGFGEEMESKTTLRGTWNVNTTEKNAFALASVSYLMKYPSETPPTVVYVRGSVAAECGTLAEPEKAACEAEIPAAKVHCSGSASTPTADPGYLCFYVTFANSAHFKVSPFTQASGATLYGTTLVLQPSLVGSSPAPLIQWGTWAVTAS